MSIADFFDSAALRIPVRNDRDDFVAFLQDRFDAFTSSLLTAKASTQLPDAYAKINHAQTRRASLTLFPHCRG